MAARRKPPKSMSARCRKKGNLADLSQIVEQDWNEARRRAAIMRPLMDVERCRTEASLTDRHRCDHLSLTAGLTVC
jgi:hypothetical protein